MNRTDAPKKQPIPFAVNGQREDLLTTTPAGDNTASYNLGFPPVTMILKAAGGLPPKGQDMNQILFELSNLSRWFSAGALNNFDSSFASSISGYPKGSVLLSNDSSTIYVSTVDGNTNNPNTGGSGWKNLLDFLGMGDGKGRLINIQTITATSTYTPTSGTKFIIVELVGGGGGGGGAPTTNASQTASGGGGGGGGYVRKLITSGFSGQAITIGGGGLGATGGSASGDPGGSTTFMGLVASGGGGGGAGSPVTAAALNGQGGNPGGGSGGDINAAGDQGSGGVMYSTTYCSSGAGGGNKMYPFDYGAGRITNNNGLPGNRYGCGGSGGNNGNSQSTTRLGGNGTGGVVVIWEYA